MQSTPRSWVPGDQTSGFGLANLPYGVYQPHGQGHLGVAIGEAIFDLHDAAAAGLFDGIVARSVLGAPCLNALLAAGPHVWAALRARLVALLREDAADLREINRDALLASRAGARLRMPFEVADFVDFYSSLEHASNLGKIFRPGGDPLMPNWRWMPVGYNGRASTIVVDGTPIVRPSGQRKGAGDAVPTFGPSRELDIEVEIGFVTGPGNPMGTPIPLEHARDHIFGVVLVNDWSARDIQSWEYQPLGPFLGKSFATSISPWVVTLDALEPYRVGGPVQEPPPLPYLQCAQAWNYDLTLLADLQTKRMRSHNIDPQIIVRTNAKGLYWNMAQQLAHATVNGTAVRPGDLYASGTISGTQPQSYGSLIELTWRGTRPLHLPSGEQRTFLEDADLVRIRGFCEAAGKPRIDFGGVCGTIVKSAV